MSNSTNYYSTLTKKELKARLKYSEARLADAKYKEYLCGMLPANYGNIAADIEDLKLAIAQPKTRPSRTKSVKTKQDTLVYSLSANKLHITTSEDGDLVSRMADDYKAMGYDVQIYSSLKL